MAQQELYYMTSTEMYANVNEKCENGTFDSWLHSIIYSVLSEALNGGNQKNHWLHVSTNQFFQWQNDPDIHQQTAEYLIVCLNHQADKVNEYQDYRKTNGLKPVGAACFARKAAEKAIRQRVGDANKRAQTGSLTVKTANGESIDLLNKAEYSAKDGYGTAALRIDLERAIKDKLDGIILSMRMCEVEQQRIADKVQLSQTAVWKRLKAIKDRYNRMSRN